MKPAASNFSSTGVFLWRSMLRFYATFVLAMKNFLCWGELLVQVFPVGLSPEVRTSLCDVQNSGIYFSEMTVKFIQVQTDMKALLPAINQQCGIVSASLNNAPGPSTDFNHLFPCEQNAMCDRIF